MLGVPIAAGILQPYLGLLGTNDYRRSSLASVEFQSSLTLCSAAIAVVSYRNLVRRFGVADQRNGIANIARRRGN